MYPDLVDFPADEAGNKMATQVYDRFIIAALLLEPLCDRHV